MQSQDSTPPTPKQAVIQIHQHTKSWFNSSIAHSHDSAPPARSTYHHIDFETFSFRGTYHKIGHYTQMMWAHTTDLGCAVSYYTVKQESNKQRHFYFLVCNYGPGGNYIGSPVYDQGKPCKGCPRGKECDREYSALCKRPTNVTKIDKSFVPIFKL